MAVRQSAQLQFNFSPWRIDRRILPDTILRDNIWRMWQWLRQGEAIDRTRPCTEGGSGTGLKRGSCGINIIDEQ